MNIQKQKRGVTLVEIAIVLVIIGLLLGGVLKGQELINNAKVRAIADRQNSLKAAWFAFIDRFQALPGDFKYAGQYIPGAVNDLGGDGFITEMESPIVLQNLTGAGYLRCPQCTASEVGTPASDNSLQNNYGGIMGIFSDSAYYVVKGGANNRPRLQVHTGPRIPSNIIAEVDRKLDDGVANTGDFVFNVWDPTNGDLTIRGGDGADAAADCISQSQESQDSGDLDHSTEQWWRHAAATPPVEQDCGGSVNI